MKTFLFLPIMATAVRFIMDIIAIVTYAILIGAVAGAVFSTVIFFVFHKKQNKLNNFITILLAILLFIVAGGIFHIVCNTNFLAGSRFAIP